MSMSIFKEKKEEPKKVITPVAIYEFRDFREVRDLYIESKADKNINDFIKICLTNHAYNRICNEFNRYCPIEEVEDMFRYFADRVINFPFEEEFSFTDYQLKICIHGTKSKINGYTSLILHSVVRNFDVRPDGTENVRELKINYKNKRM